MTEKKLVIGDVLQAYQDFLAFFPLKYFKTRKGIGMKNQNFGIDELRGISQ